VIVRCIGGISHWSSQLSFVVQWYFDNKYNTVSSRDTTWSGRLIKWQHF